MLFNFSVSLLIGLEMGHWKSVPEFFPSLHTLRFASRSFIPCIYALLPDKSKDTYRRFFEEVRNTLYPEHSHQDIMIDFDIAAINAVEGTEMKDCFFHLCSNLWTSAKIHRWCWMYQYTSNDCGIGTCSTWWSRSLFWTILWLSSKPLQWRLRSNHWLFWGYLCW